MPAAAECTQFIALVDDADEFRSATHAALEGAGYRVASFASAEDLLRCLETGSPAVDLFIVDLCLPGLQGEELVRRLLWGDPSSRILVISGASAEGRREDLGLGPVLEKPFRVAELLRRCELLLRR